MSVPTEGAFGPGTARARDPIGPWEIAALAIADFFAALVAFFGVVLAPTYSGMFRDFGGELPLLTRLFLQPLVPIAVSAGLMLFTGTALLFPRRAARIALCAVAAFVALLTITLFFVAMYLPIFSLAGNISGP